MNPDDNLLTLFWISYATVAAGAFLLGKEWDALGGAIRIPTLPKPRPFAWLRRLFRRSQ